MLQTCTHVKQIVKQQTTRHQSTHQINLLTKTTLKYVHQPIITQQLKIITKINMFSNNILRQVCYIIHKPCVNNTTSKCLQPCTKYVPIMHQLLINYDSSRCTNINQLYTSCMCQLINYLSQPCTQHVPQPKSLINFIIQI
jgi:hypothetical protein